MASTEVARTKMAQTETTQTEAAQRDQDVSQPTVTTTGEPGEAGHPRTATVHLRFVTAEFRVPHIHLPSLPVHIPDRHELSSAVSSIWSRLPSPSQTAYYAGLGLLGALGIIEWPVVIAVGVGTALAYRQFGSTPAGFRVELVGGEAERKGQEPAEPQEDPRDAPGQGG